MTRRSAQAAGARGHHVGPAQFIQQVGAHDPDELRGAGKREDQDRHRQVLQQIDDLRPGPGRQLLFGGEQAADIHAEQPQPEIHHDQRQQEVGDGKPDEAQEGEDVVAERVLPHRGVDADRQCQPPGDDDGAQRQQNGQPQPVTDDLGHRPPVFERAAEVAARHHGEPLPVLHPQRLIEAVGEAHGIRLGGRDRRARGGRLCRVGGDEIHRRQVQDAERHHRDGEDGDRCQHQAAGEVVQHATAAHCHCERSGAIPASWWRIASSLRSSQ